MPGIWSDLLATPAGDWRELVGSQDDTPEDWGVSIPRSGYPTPALELADDDARAPKDLLERPSTRDLAGRYDRLKRHTP